MTKRRIYKTFTERQRLEEAFKEVEQKGLDTILIQEEIKTEDFPEEVLKKYRAYRDYLDYTNGFEESKRKSSLEEICTKFEDLSEEYKESFPVFARNCLINIGIAAEMIASFGEDNIKWYLKSHDARKKAYELAAASDYKRTYFILSFAGNSSQNLFEIVTNINEKLKWGEMCFEERLSAGKAAEKNNDLKYAGHVLSFAGNIAEDLSNLVDGWTKVYWLKKSYYARIKASMDSELDENIPHAFHVYTFAANMAKNVAELSESVENKILWYEKAFEGQSKAGYLSKEEKPNHSIYCLSFAGELAKTIMNLSIDKRDKTKWGNHSYKRHLESAQIAEKVDKKHCVVEFAKAGDIAEKLFDLHDNPEEKKEWGEKSYLYRLKSAELRCDNNTIREATYTLGYTAKIAQKIAELVRSKEEKLDWYKKSYTLRKKIIELNNFDNKFFAYSCSFAGDDAFHLHELTDNINEKINYLMESYTYRRVSEGLSKDFNLKHARISLGFANSVAKILGQIHPDIGERKKWTKIFQKGIEEFKKYNILKPN